MINLSEKERKLFNAISSEFLATLDESPINQSVTVALERLAVIAFLNNDTSPASDALRRVLTYINWGGYRDTPAYLEHIEFN